MAIDWNVLAIPKGCTRQSLKRKAKREKGDHVSETRIYVQGRERGRCRCCRRRDGQSMHEIVPKSLGGKVSKANSIWVCGDGVQGCHGFLQRHEIRCPVDLQKYASAEGPLLFRPMTPAAANWMRISISTCLISEPMRNYEDGL